MARLGLILMTFLAVCGAWLAPDDPMKTDLDRVYEPPSERAWLGTDGLGRDVLSRTLHGGRATLLYGLSAAILGLVIGGGIGVLRAFGQPLVAGLAEGVIVGLASLPAWLLALSVIAGAGASATSLIIGVGLTQIAPYARIVAWSMTRAQSEPYYLASIALGASRPHLAVRVVLPNVLPILTGSACVVLAGAILFSSGLTFLGLGGVLGVPEWGAMLAEGRGALRYAPWVALPPAVLLIAWTACLNSIGRGISAP